MAEYEYMDDTPEAEPTVDEIARKRDWLNEVWSTARTNWGKVDAWLKGDVELWPDKYKDRPQYHPARASSIVDHVVDNGLSYDPVVRRGPGALRGKRKKRGGPG